MLNKDQSQTASDGATAIQAGGNVTVNNAGLSYSEVRGLALDVFRANFCELAGTAKEIAKSRAEEITEAFLKKLVDENPMGLAKSRDPDFQYALFTVQKEYARCGDKELGDLLVDLLVDRSKQDKRNILQIVLNESLITATKLTESHLASLSIIFLFAYVKYTGTRSHEQFGDFLDRYVLPFSSKLANNHSAYQHLEFSGCGSIGMGQISLEKTIGASYQGLFFKGFDEIELHSRGIGMGRDPRFFVPCLNEATKLQVAALNKEELDYSLKAASISEDVQQKLLALFEVGKMSEEEIKQKTVSIRPYMSDVYSAWAASSMKSFRLTSVGMAIGHANIKRFTGEFADLSLWIN